MTCPKCNKLAYEREVATKTKEVDGNVVVLAKRRAIVCDKHGVLAWDPPVAVTPIPYVPTPWITPNRPPPWQSPFTSQITHNPVPRAFNTCSTVGG